jgi:hypothetical protein
VPGIDYLLENLLPAVEAEKPVPQDLGTGGGRSQWCNRLLEAIGTCVAGFLLDGEAGGGTGMAEHHGVVVRLEGIGS